MSAVLLATGMQLTGYFPRLINTYIGNVSGVILLLIYQLRVKKT